MGNVWELDRQTESLPESLGCPGAGTSSSSAVIDFQHRKSLFCKGGGHSDYGKGLSDKDALVEGKAKNETRMCKDLEVPKAEGARWTGSGHTVLYTWEVFMEGNRFYKLLRAEE